METIDPPLPRYHDITGKIFGRLTILSYAGKAGKESIWLSRCKCGVEKVVRYNGLTRGATTSCGCYRREVHAKRRARPKGHERTFKNPLYRIWQSMKTRCYNEKNPNYARYGAKGVRICQRWLDSFDTFVDDMGMPPEGHSIDRIDPYGDYSPENCRWATRLIQSQNQKRTRFYQWQGESLCLTEVARRANVDYYQVYWAVFAGKSIDEAVQSITKPFTERARSLNPSLPPKPHASTTRVPSWPTFRQTVSDQNTAPQPEGKLGMVVPVRVRETMRGTVSEPQGEARPVVRVPEEGQACEI